MPLDAAAIEDGLARAFERFLTAYSSEGGHRFPGFVSYKSPSNYQGPLIWSEGDAQFRLALELETEFPGMVHIEAPRARYTDPDLRERAFIDIVVTDLSAFRAGTDVFAEHQHELFVEVKYVGHQSAYRAAGQRTIRDGVRADLLRLQSLVERKKCKAAAMLVVDDNSYVDSPAGQDLPWSPLVQPLLASPTQLGRLAFAKRIGVALPSACPSCGSPRIAPVQWGEPPPDIEAAAARYELVLGGCEPLGRGLDPTFSCLDCGQTDSQATPAGSGLVAALERSRRGL